jgi:hypothetical protein
VSVRGRVLLSFDAEEFDLPCERGAAIRPDEQMRVGIEGFERTLALLDRLADELGTPLPTTFFCTAVFAAACPGLVRRAVERGHEIASHGWSHSAFELADLRRSREAIEQVSGRAVVGFRRARLAETDRGAIEAAGYWYNSSENPTWLPGRYNRFFKPRLPYFTGGLLNIPASCTPVVRFPLFWLSFKACPLWATKLAAKSVLLADPGLALYFHPWELCDLSGYDVPGYVKACDGAKMTGKLERYIRWLARQGRFSTYADLAAQIRAGAGVGCDVPVAGGAGAAAERRA